MNQRLLLCQMITAACVVAFSVQTLSAQTKTDISKIDFVLTHQYRNQVLAPTWPIYHRDFAAEPNTAILPPDLQLSMAAFNCLWREPGTGSC